MAEQVTANPTQKRFSSEAISALEEYRKASSEKVSFDLGDGFTQEVSADSNGNLVANDLSPEGKVVQILTVLDPNKDNQSIILRTFPEPVAKDEIGDLGPGKGVILTVENNQLKIDGQAFLNYEHSTIHPIAEVVNGKADELNQRLSSWNESLAKWS